MSVKFLFKLWELDWLLEWWNAQDAAGPYHFGEIGSGIWPILDRVDIHYRDESDKLQRTGLEMADTTSKPPPINSPA